MSQHEKALAARRALLAARSAAYRETITAEFDSWHGRALAADRFLEAIYRYRALVALGLGFGTVLGFRKRAALVRWLRRGWFGFGVWQALRGATKH